MTDDINDRHKGKPELRLVSGKRNDSEAVELGKIGQGNIPGASGRAASGLTNKQEAFAIALSEGMTNNAAYRASYDASGMQATSVDVEACKLAASPKIARRVADLLAAKQAKTQLVSARTEDRIWRGVWELAEGADIAPATKATALALAARMAGLFNDRIEIKQAGTAADIERELMERLQRYAK
jgi:hypothetical protein